VRLAERHGSGTVCQRDSGQFGLTPAVTREVVFAGREEHLGGFLFSRQRRDDLAGHLERVLHLGERLHLDGDRDLSRLAGVTQRRDWRVQFVRRLFDDCAPRATPSGFA